MNILYGYSKCGTVKKTIKWLNENNIQFKHIDNVDNRLTSDELKKIHLESGLDIKKLFNTSGLKYRELNLKNKLDSLTMEDKYEILASDGMLVKRPIFIGSSVLIAFNQKVWEEALIIK